MDCKKELRREIDRAFYIADRPTNERYALINHKYDGSCPLIDEEGYCSLQRACGEEAIPLVCRMYPRAVKKGELYELSCSGSCEKTLELLTENTRPLEFETAEPKILYDGIILTNPRAQSKTEIRKLAAEKMRDRKEPLCVRLHAVGKIVNGPSDENAPTFEKIPKGLGEKALRFIVRMLLRFESMSAALSRYVPSALANLGITEEIFEDADALASAAEKYKLANEHFFTVLPEAEAYLEKMMINHMFYEQFPYTDFEETNGDAYLALCASYAILKFLSVSYMADKSKKDDFISVAAAVFRFTEHTSFYKNAMILMKNEGFADEDSAFELIEI